MVPINTIFNYFGGWNRCQQWLSISVLDFDEYLSLLSQKKKHWKIRKIKFGVKFEFLTTKGTNHLLIEKKMGD
jgi:hypothetical protein